MYIYIYMYACNCHHVTLFIYNNLPLEYVAEVLLKARPTLSQSPFDRVPVMAHMLQITDFTDAPDCICCPFQPSPDLAI